MTTEKPAANDKKGLEVALILAVAMGILTDNLIFKNASGVSFFIVNFAVIAVSFALANKYQKKIIFSQSMIAGSILLLSFSILARSNPFLSFVDVIVVIYLTALFFAMFSDSDLRNYKLLKYIIYPLLHFLDSMRSAGKRIEKEVGASRGNYPGSKKFWSIMRGIAIAAPFLVILGLLLYSSDMVIQSYFEKFGRIEVDVELIFHLLIILALSFIFTGMFFRVVSTEKYEINETGKKGILTLGHVEVLTVLSLLEVMFLLYIIFQFCYLFGGKDYVWGASEMITYSSYARKGFFELLLFSLISFALIHSLDGARERKSEKEAKILKISETVIIAEVIIIVFSAFKRVALYIDGYGLTFARFIAIMMLIWCLCAFLVLLAKILLEKRSVFIYHTMFWISGGLLIFVNVINPDALIARTNIERINSLTAFHYEYFSALSIDAIPEMAKIFHSDAKEEAKREIAKSLYARYNPDFVYPCRFTEIRSEKLCKYIPIGELIEESSEKRDWRSFNYSRIKADLALKENSEEIDRYFRQYIEDEADKCIKNIESCETACKRDLYKEIIIQECKERCALECDRLRTMVE